MTTDEAAALRDVCAITRLDSRDALLLHRHATVVYHLPRADAVARIAPSDHAEAARLSIQVTRWLLSSGFPATAPLDIEQPVVVRHSVVTFWHYHPQGNLPLPPVTRLAGLLRRLHSFGSPPFPLPPYKPLKGFLSALATFGHAVLQKEEHEFLRNRADRVLHDYRRMTSELGHGLIHGDPRTGNLLWDGEDVVLGDWDSVSYGPRELDLIITYQGVRYGRSEATLNEFARIYGWDIRSWHGFETLREMRDLHTLSALLRLATNRVEVSEELHHRIRSLQTADNKEQWLSF